MPSFLEIRAETEADLDRICNVDLRAFPTDVEARLVDQLRIGGDLTFSLVAVVDGDVVGHVGLSPVTIDGIRVGLGLAPVAVVPERQRTGIGSAMIRHALQLCREKAVGLVVVLGDPAYYSRLNFVPASRYGMQDTYGGGDAFQAVLLSAGPPPRGIVQYAPAFSMFE